MNMFDSNTTTSIGNFEKIIKEFACLPTPSIEPSFLSLSRLSGDRFEERCSKIIQFFLDPNQPHRLRNLFIHSFLEILDCTEYEYHSSAVSVIVEESTSENKRIDITVISDSFVLAIENKILAPLYNRLDVYRSHIEDTYPNLNKLFVVLSVRPITKAEEYKRMADNGYVNITYDRLIYVLKKNLGLYATECNQTYLVFLFDFIKTIEDSYYNPIKEEMNTFFYENREVIKNLVQQYDLFQKEISKLQADAISEVKDCIIEKTGGKWWIYRGWDLEIRFNEGTEREIGIESSFESDDKKHNPIGIFRIYITTWKKECFAPFEGKLRNAFPECYIDKAPENNSNRVYLHIPPINSDNFEIIVKELERCYLILKKIVEE